MQKGLKYTDIPNTSVDSKFYVKVHYEIVTQCEKIHQKIFISLFSVEY